MCLGVGGGAKIEKMYLALFSCTRTWYDVLTFLLVAHFLEILPVATKQAETTMHLDARINKLAHPISRIVGTSRKRPTAKPTDNYLVTYSKSYRLAALVVC